MVNDINVKSKTFSRRALLLLVLFISGLFVHMIRGFLVSLLLAAIFSAMLYPAYQKLVSKFRGRRVLAAVCIIILVFFAIIGPLFTLFGVVVAQAFEVSKAIAPRIQEQLQNPGELQLMLDRIPFLADLAPYRDDIISKVGQVAGQTASLVGNWIAAGTKGTAKFLLMMFVMLYAIYYFLLEGPAVLKKFLYYLPLEDEDEQLMLDRFTSVTRATLKGTLVIGVIQGGLAGSAFAVAGFQGPVFWGTIMAVLSFLPGIGIALVWVPAALFLLITEHTFSAIALAAWCGGFAGTVDNILRPRIVGKDTKMPDLMILLSTLGGLAMFGAVGIIIGPLIAALFITVWSLYGRAFADVLPPVGKAAKDKPVERKKRSAKTTAAKNKTVRKKTAAKSVKRK